jgi:hypothetical protein
MDSTSVESNRRQFRVWRDAVVRLAKRDRYKNELRAAERRVIARALEYGICDCPQCVARIVKEDVARNWPNCVEVR